MSSRLRELEEEEKKKGPTVRKINYLTRFSEEEERKMQYDKEMKKYENYNQWKKSSLNHLQKLFQCVLVSLILLGVDLFYV